MCGADEAVSPVFRCTVDGGQNFFAFSLGSHDDEVAKRQALAIELGEVIEFSEVRRAPPRDLFVAPVIRIFKGAAVLVT
jgi:hypothetical protein